MDILAHGLWTAAGAKAINNRNSPSRQNERPFNVGWAAFWGVFPDLFAFGVPFVWTIYNLAVGAMHLSDWPAPAHDIEPVPYTHLQPLQLANSLYNLSHSLIVFVLILALVSIIWRKVPRELFGWLLHILIDIPTHSYRFFPTPFLWPVSGFKFAYGIAWGQWWFQAINYAALIAVYCLLYRHKTKSAPKRANFYKVS